MAVSRSAALRALFVGLWSAGWISVGTCSSAVAQDVPARPEVVPTPPPETAPRPAPQAEAPELVLQPQPDPQFGPMDAAREARERAELQRRWAIDRQRQLIDDIRRYHVASPTAYRYALPYIYAYTPPRVARRVHETLERYSGPAITPWPHVPDGGYGNLYFPPTDPSIYLPQPTPAMPPAAAVPPPVAVAPLRVPTPAVGPAEPAPAIPPAAPRPAESGPREF